MAVNETNGQDPLVDDASVAVKDLRVTYRVMADEEGSSADGCLGGVPCRCTRCAASASSPARARSLASSGTTAPGSRRC